MFYNLILSLITSLAIALIAGPVVIPFLIRLKFGQEIREIGPSWHKKKRGTPTMGGVIFIFSVMICALLFMRTREGLCLVLFGVSFGVIGFADDFIKVVKRRNLGLTEMQKFTLQLLASIIFLYAAMQWNIVNSEVIIPFVKKTVDFGIFYIPFALFVLIGTTNSVNLTDGVDGLASSVTVIVTLFFGVAAVKQGDTTAALFAGAIAGGCIGFLAFNRHPAKVFMGDTGSLFLGGAVCALALRLKMPLVLIIAGGVYVMETLSVIIQVTSFKLTGKRVFKMSPIHHHFEMCGWSEVKIVLTFSAVSLVLALIAYWGGIAVV